MRKLLVVAALFALSTFALAQQQPNWDAVEIKVHKVAGTVYMLEGRGGNIGVSVGEDGILIVDDQYAPLAPKIEAALKGIADQPVKFVLNTHWHGDHTGGNEQFGKMAPIIAHTNVRKRLKEGMDSPQRKVPPAPKGALPVITFDERLVVHINGEDIRAVHSPHAHTDGDLIIYFTASNVVHMGDNFFRDRFPFIDLASGGSAKGLIASVERVVNEAPADAKVIPGHGPLSTLEDLKRYLAMLKDTTAMVEAALKQGKTAEQMKQEKLLQKYATWSPEGSFINADRFIDTLAQDLGKK